MNLYLHIGLNKTGSSFLQTMFVRNRKLLESNGFFFPFAKRHEKNMLSGKITPGNGSELNSALMKKNRDEVLKILSTSVIGAEKSNCNNIVFSNERLFVAFSDESNLKTLIDVCEEIGIKKINIITFLRDPVSHVISMYKHRSKSGRNPDFDKWIEEEYETVHVLKKFMNIYKKYAINWNFRKYHKNSDLMLKATFNDWLNIPILVDQEIVTVNPSLKLSEILVLQNVYKKNPYLTKFLYDSFLSLDATLKADDSELELYYKFKAHKFLENHKEIYRKSNEILPLNEKLRLDIKDKNEVKELAVLTKYQINQMAKAITESQKLNSKINYFISRFKGRVYKFLKLSR